MPAEVGGAMPPPRRRLPVLRRLLLLGGALWVALRAASQAFVPAPGRAPAAGPLQRAAAGDLAPPAELQLAAFAAPAAAALLAGFSAAGSALAQQPQDLTPDTFRPVCPASDGLYNGGKGIADALLGSEGAEYRPLAIEALLRVRLEICVLESFVYEAIVPFVQRKGLGWILPFHETIDTVIAGTVFAVALNFILFGTTKILAVLSIYHDFLLGAPLRLIGFAILPEKQVKKDPPLIQINWPGMAPPPEQEPEEQEERPPPPAPLAIFGGVCKAYGVFAGIAKNVFEGVDTFVGRYLVVTSVAYIGFKWAHFRIFPDFPPF